MRIHLSTGPDLPVLRFSTPCSLFVPETVPETGQDMLGARMYTQQGASSWTICGAVETIPLRAAASMRLYFWKALVRNNQFYLISSAAPGSDSEPLS
jgi:hypothetical protein